MESDSQSCVRKLGMQGVKPELEALKRDNSDSHVKVHFYSNDVCLEFCSCKYDSCLCTFTGTYRHRSTVGCPQWFMCVFWISHIDKHAHGIHQNIQSIFFSFSHTLAQKLLCTFAKLSALIPVFLHPPPSVQCNHASASTYLMPIWISAEWLIISATHNEGTLCGCF